MYQHALLVHLFDYSGSTATACVVQLCLCVFVFVFFLNVHGCMWWLCTCVCVFSEVTGNLKCELFVSAQRDDFLRQQTVSRKIVMYYDEINFNGQGFQIFSAKWLMTRTLNDTFLCSELFCCLVYITEVSSGFSFVLDKSCILWQPKNIKNTAKCVTHQLVLACQFVVPSGFYKFFLIK